MKHVVRGTVFGMFLAAWSLHAMQPEQESFDTSVGQIFNFIADVDLLPRIDLAYLAPGLTKVVQEFVHAGPGQGEAIWKSMATALCKINLDYSVGGAFEQFEGACVDVAESTSDWPKGLAQHRAALAQLRRISAVHEVALQYASQCSSYVKELRERYEAAQSVKWWLFCDVLLFSDNACQMLGQIPNISTVDGAWALEGQIEALSNMPSDDPQRALFYDAYKESPEKFDFGVCLGDAYNKHLHEQLRAADARVINVGELEKALAELKKLNDEFSAEVEKARALSMQH